MKLAVHGMACRGSFGAGVADLVSALPLRPVHKGGYAPTADVAPLKEKLPPRSLRQMDHFTRMALLCLLETLDNAALSPEDATADTGIVLVTGYGSATSTFAFLDSILAYGDQAASPLAFSHSVHNIPAASLAMRLDLAGPCATFCQINNPVGAGLLTARQWLMEGRVSRVLFGAVDELTPLLSEATRRESAERAACPHCRPGLRAALPIGEGAAFFCLGPETEEPATGWIDDITYAPPASGIAARMSEDMAADPVLGHSPAPASGPVRPMYLSGAVPPGTLALPGTRHAGTVYGNLPVAQAFDLVLALADPANHTPATAICRSFGARGEVVDIYARQNGRCKGPA